MRPIFSDARRAFATAVLVSTIASLPGVVIAAPGNTAPVPTNPTIYFGPSGVASVETSTLATDADPGDTLTYNLGSASNGTVARNGSKFEYTPGPGFAGTGSFIYFVDDATVSATGTVTVKQDLTPPSIDLPGNLVLFAGPSGTLLLPNLTGRVSTSDGTGSGVVAPITQSPAPGTELSPGIHPITFTVTDAAGNTASGTINIEVVTSLNVAKAAGEAVEGEPEGTKVQRFGVPSINQLGETAYLGRLSAPGTRSTLAILAGDPVSVRTRVGDDAVGITGAKFNFFLDPVLDDSSNVAFIARVSGEGVVPENDRGVWVHNGTGLQLVAREGVTPVPGAPGAQFKRFSSISIKDGQVLFLAELVQGVGGIDKTNDVGVWAWDAVNGLRPFVREKDTVTTASGPKTVSVFSMLRSAGTSRGQGRSQSGSIFGIQGAPSLYTLWAKYTDGTKAILAGLPSNVGGEPGPTFDLFAVADTRTALNSPDSGLVPKELGLPAVNSTLGFAAHMTLASNSTAGVNRDNNTGIFVGSLFFGGGDEEAPVWEPIVRKGDSAIEGANWLGFKDPIINNNYDIAWIGRISGTGVTTSNDYVIGYARLLYASTSEVIAREGGAVPGVEGAKWSQFLSLALPDGKEEGIGGPLGIAPANGPIFLARIVADSSAAEPANITPANDVGVWAVDGNGDLRLLLREGDTVKVNGVDKQVRSMTLLNSVSGSRDVSRSFNDRGEVVLKARFTDNSEAVLTLRMPVREADPQGV